MNCKMKILLDNGTTINPEIGSSYTNLTCSFCDKRFTFATGDSRHHELGVCDHCFAVFKRLKQYLIVAEERNE